MGSKISKNCTHFERSCETAEGRSVCTKCCDLITKTCTLCNKRTEKPYAIVRFRVRYGRWVDGATGAGKPYCEQCASSISDWEYVSRL